jgi:hypothetical protein
MKSGWIFAGAVGCLGVWIFLAFVAAVPNGWVHIFLALGTTLVGVAIVEGGPADGGGRTANDTSRPG